MRFLSSVSALALLGLAGSQALAADLPQDVAPVAAHAMPDVSAVLSLWAGGAALDSNDAQFSEDAYFVFGGDARFAGQAWQLEITGGHISDTDGSGDKEGSEWFAGAGHWLNRADHRTWGLFAGASSTGFQDSNDHAVHLFGGLEGAWFTQSNTFFGQVGGVYAAYGETTDTWESGGFGRVGMRHFFTEYSKLEADVMAGFGEFDANDTGWTGAWGVEYERKMMNNPFSFFGAYRGHYVEDSDNNDMTDHVFTIGLRVDVGTDNLLERDRYGAGTFNIPDFQRAFSFPEDL